MKQNQSFPEHFLLFALSVFVFMGCKAKVDTAPTTKADYIEKVIDVIQPIGATISARFVPPLGYARTEIDTPSFAAYLRSFHLLEVNAPVHLYNGALKMDQSVHASVLDIDVGKRDLQQCADAVMRLRAEYLLEQRKYNDIAFNFTNGWRFEYTKWRAGNDLSISGNNTSWKPGSSPKESYNDFRKYMNHVFMYAGTLSLSKELKKKKLEDIAIGDVFIVGGSPGHAVLVVDMAANADTGDKVFMLAQSYMPAQQIHILKNKNNSEISPWYSVDAIENNVYTPEWTFSESDLMSF